MTTRVCDGGRVASHMAVEDVVTVYLSGAYQLLSTAGTGTYLALLLQQPPPLDPQGRVTRGLFIAVIALAVVVSGVAFVLSVLTVLWRHVRLISLQLTLTVALGQSEHATQD